MPTVFHVVMPGATRTFATADGRRGYLEDNGPDEYGLQADEAVLCESEIDEDEYRLIDRWHRGDRRP